MNKMKKTNITLKTKFSEVLQKDDKVAEILMSKGMSCFGCPMAMEETIEDGCISHGMTKKETEELIKELNGGK